MASPGNAYIADSLMHSLWHINAPKCRTTGILIGGFASAFAPASASASADHCIIIIIIRLMDSCLQLQPGRQAADRKCYCNMQKLAVEQQSMLNIWLWTVSFCDACVCVGVCAHIHIWWWPISPAKPRNPTGPLSIVLPCHDTRTRPSLQDSS